MVVPSYIARARPSQTSGTSSSPSSRLGHLCTSRPIRESNVTSDVAPQFSAPRTGPPSAAIAEYHVRGLWQHGLTRIVRTRKSYDGPVETLWVGKGR
jgi:hypothetical protein